MVLLGLLSGCSVYDEGLLEVDAGVPRPGCTAGSKEAPARPSQPDDPLAEVPEVVFALKDVVLDGLQEDETGTPLWQIMGYNLDNRCTDAENMLFACRSPGMSPVTAVDGFEGVDNVFGRRLFPLVSVSYLVTMNDYAPTLQEYAQRVQQEGMAVIVIRIRGWNGEANDSRVFVDISQSVHGGPGTATTPPTYSDTLLPEWNGNDWFWLRDDAFISGDLAQPIVFDDTAYISDWHLVATLPDRAVLDFVGPGLGLQLAITEGFAVGRIDESLTLLHDVEFGGRWSKTDLLKTAAAVEVCPGTPVYDTIFNAIDNFSDVRSDADEDGVVGPDGMLLPCNAVSMGASFQGYAAHVAGVMPGPALPNPCAP